MKARKMLAVLLVLCMVLSAMPVSLLSSVAADNLSDRATGLNQLTEKIDKVNVTYVTSQGSKKSGDGEGTDQLFDGDLGTKVGCSIGDNKVATLTIPMTEAVTLTCYTFGTANDEPGRDPKSWTVAGSNDGSTWTTIDTVSDYVFTDARSSYLEDDFVVDQPAAYSWYRVTITDWRSIGSGGYSQFSEFVMSSQNVSSPDNPEDVQACIDAIAAIGTVEFTDDCLAKINAAAGKYDALSGSLDRAFVTNYETLLAAQASYAALKVAYQKNYAETTGNLLSVDFAVSTSDIVDRATFTIADNDYVTRKNTVDKDGNTSDLPYYTAQNIGWWKHYASFTSSDANTGAYNPLYLAENGSTISMWVYPDQAFKSTEVLFDAFSCWGSSDMCTYRVKIYLNNDGTLAIDCGSGGNANVTNYSTSGSGVALTQNTWNMVTATQEIAQDGTVTTELYVNAVLAGSTTNLKSFRDSTYKCEEYSVGSPISGGGNDDKCFGGYIQTLSIINSHSSAADVYEAYTGLDFSDGAANALVAKIEALATADAADLAAAVASAAADYAALSTAERELVSNYAALQYYQAVVAVDMLQAATPSTKPSYLALLDAAEAAIAVASAANQNVEELTVVVTGARSVYENYINSLVKLDNASVVTPISGVATGESEGFEKLFDSDLATKMCKSDVGTIVWKTDAAYLIAGYSLTTGGDSATYGGRSPASWTLEASVDGETYTVIDSTSNSGMGNYNDKEYQYLLETPDKYQYFKITFNETKMIQLDEISLYVVGDMIDAEVKPGVAVATENAFDLTWNVALIDVLEDSFETFNRSYDIVDAGFIVTATSDDMSAYGLRLAESSDPAASEPGRAYKESIGTTIYSNFSYRRTGVQNGCTRYVAVYITYVDESGNTFTVLSQENSAIAVSGE